MKIIFASLIFALPLLAKPIISVSIPPQSYFVQKIAGDSVELNEIIPPNTDEHNFDFKPSVIEKLEKSHIYFTIGLEFEKILLHKFKDLFKELKIVDSTEGIKAIEISSKHTHHEEEHHEEHLNDPHIWLDPLLVKTMVDTIAKALIKQYPHNKALYEANLAHFKKELDMLDMQIKSLLKDKKGKKFIVYHPSWAYFARRYDLIQISVEIDGKEPKVKDLKALIELAKKEKIQTIFVQKGFPKSTAELLAKECSADIVEIDHLSRAWQGELLNSAKKLAGMN